MIMNKIKATLLKWIQRNQPKKEKLKSKKQMAFHIIKMIMAMIFLCITILTIIVTGLKDNYIGVGFSLLLAFIYVDYLWISLHEKPLPKKWYEIKDIEN